MTRAGAGAVKAASILGLAALVGGCEARGGEKRDAAAFDRPVLVTTVRYEQVVRHHTIVATVRARTESDLGFRVSGRVARRLVEVGDRVHAGTPIATLDPADLQLQVEQAQADVAAARSSVQQAEADLERAEGLAAKGWTAQSALGRQRSLTEEARSRFLRADRALKLANNSLAYAILVADADGVVMSTGIEPGQVVAAGQVSARIARTSEREAVVAIPEALVGRTLDDRAQLSLWSDPSRSYEVRLRELAPVADPTTRTFLARYSIPAADDRARLGMTATLTVNEGAAERVARVPASAVFDRGTGPCVFVVARGGKLVSRPVRVARFEGADAILLGGVDDADRVVRLGVHKLEAGQQVHEIEAAGS